MGGVPDIFVIDAEGAVVTRVQGWRDDRDPALMRMWLAKLTGVPRCRCCCTRAATAAARPARLPRAGERDLGTHPTCDRLRHARAPRGSRETRVRRLSRRRLPEARWLYDLAAHEPTSRTSAARTATGGVVPHLSPDVRQEDRLRGRLRHLPRSRSIRSASTTPPSCRTISHAANAQLASLPLAEKQKLLAERGATPRDLLPATAAYVGSDACQSCHAKEFETWSTAAACPRGRVARQRRARRTTVRA